jgi:acetylornithine/succinyldiaminopimelate/putrescine aminotransferase
MALAATDDYGNRWGPLAPGFQRIPFGDINAADRALTSDIAAVTMETTG